MATIAEIEAEIKRWQGIAGERERDVQTLERQLDKLSPNGAIDFRDIKKYNATKEALLSARNKRDSARAEVNRLQDAGDELRRQIAELEQNKANYLRLQEPGAIDWSRVDVDVDRESHYAELAHKATAIDSRIEAIHG